MSLFHGFERKVVSTATVVPSATPLRGHYSNTLGGMAGGGIFAKGQLVGIHLGGISCAKSPFNVFYPIVANLFKGPLKQLLR